MARFSILSLTLHDPRALRLAGVLALALTTAGSLAACSAGGQAQPANPQAAEAEGGEGEQGGMVGVLGESLAEMTLRADQRAEVDAIRAELRAKAEPARRAGKAAGLLLADGVANGKVDHAQIEARLGDLASEVLAMKPALQGAMNRLHAMLDPAQRRELVDRMRARGERWRGMQHDAPGAGGAAGRMQALSRDLGLTTDQTQAIRTRVREEMKGTFPAMREKMLAMRDHMRAVGDAFVSDHFDAAALDIGAEAPEMARAWAGRMVRFVELSVPVLTPEQRAKLAAHIRTRAETKG